MFSQRCPIVEVLLQKCWLVDIKLQICQIIQLSKLWESHKYSFSQVFNWKACSLKKTVSSGHFKCIPHHLMNAGTRPVAVGFLWTRLTTLRIIKNIWPELYLLDCNDKSQVKINSKTEKEGQCTYGGKWKNVLMVGCFCAKVIKQTWETTLPSRKPLVSVILGFWHWATLSSAAQEVIDQLVILLRLGWQRN